MPEIQYSSGMSKPRNDDEEVSEFAKRLRARRLELNMTASQLAKLVGLTEGSIRQLEDGTSKNAIFPNGLKIAYALGVSPWWLDGKEEPAPRSAAKGHASMRKTTQPSIVPRAQAQPDEATIQEVIRRMCDPEDAAYDALRVHREPLQQKIEAVESDLLRQIQSTEQGLWNLVKRLSHIGAAQPDDEARPPDAEVRPPKDGRRKKAT